MQDPDSGLQLRVSGKSHDTGVDLVADRRLRSSQQRSMLLPRHHSGLPVLRIATAKLPQRLRVEAVCLGVAALAAVADLDHPAHLDAQVRAAGSHGEAIRGANVQLSADRPVDGTEQKKRRSTGSQSRSKYILNQKTSP